MDAPRRIVIAAMALLLVRIAPAPAEPMRFFARPANGLALPPPMGWNTRPSGCCGQGQCGRPAENAHRTDSA